MKKAALALTLFLTACSTAPAPPPVSPEVAASQTRAAGIRIVRDDWGVPHIYGKTDADVVFGLMYAQAEDDFNRVETNFLNSLGRLAEAEGESALWRDLRMKLFIDPEQLKATYQQSPEWLRALMDAWAEGLNYYLATHPEDRRRLAAEPDLMPVAVEEFLRYYSPVTMARVAAVDAEVGASTVPAGDRVLLTFPAANRHPEHFERADEFVIDRAHNRHIAFGVGIHRCAGSNLARMEMQVALGEWLAALPEFELDPHGELTFAGGQVRGPRNLPIVY